MALKLYGGAISPFTMRVAIQIKAKGLDIPLVDPPGGLHSETYRALNPIDKIPALDADGTIIPESDVIAHYLETCFPDTPLNATDAKEQANINLISRICDLYVMNAMLPLFAQLDPATRNAEVVDQTVTAVQKGLEFLDAFVGPSPFATAGRLTLADCTAGPILFYVDRFLPVVGANAPFDRFQNVSAYWSRVQETDAVREALDEMRQALDALSA